jgi:hypothetical protein
MNKFISLRQLSFILLFTFLSSGLIFNWILTYSLTHLTTRIDYIEKRVNKELLEYDKLTGDFKRQLNEYSSKFSHDITHDIAVLRWSYNKDNSRIKEMEKVVPHILVTKEHLDRIAAEIQRMKKEAEAIKKGK